MGNIVQGFIKCLLNWPQLERGVARAHFMAWLKRTVFKGQMVLASAGVFVSVFAFSFLPSLLLLLFFPLPSSLPLLSLQH